MSVSVDKLTEHLGMGPLPSEGAASTAQDIVSSYTAADRADVSSADAYATASKALAEPTLAGLWLGNRAEGALLIGGAVTVWQSTGAGVSNTITPSGKAAGYAVQNSTMHLSAEQAKPSFFEDGIYSWSGQSIESASPFAYLDAQNACDVIDVLGQARNLPRHDSLAIFRRLNELFEISREEPDQRVMSGQSLRFFLEFFAKYTSIQQPLIFLLDSGSIRCEWRAMHKRALALDFLPDGSVNYVVIAPNTRRHVTSVMSGENISWRDVIPTLEQSVDINWLER